MPRSREHTCRGFPCHVVQRSNNRQATFFAPEDYRFYLECLGDACRRCSVQVRASALAGRLRRNVRQNRC